MENASFSLLKKLVFEGSEVHYESPIAKSFRDAPVYRRIIGIDIFNYFLKIFKCFSVKFSFFHIFHRGIFIFFLFRIFNSVFLLSMK